MKAATVRVAGSTWKRSDVASTNIVQRFAVSFRLAVVVALGGGKCIVCRLMREFYRVTLVETESGRWLLFGAAVGGGLTGSLQGVCCGLAIAYAVVLVIHLSQ